MNLDDDLKNLLREFEPRKNEPIVVADVYGMSEEDNAKLANVRRLCDLGLMRHIPPGQGYRMTEAGHAQLAIIMDEGV